MQDRTKKARRLTTIQTELMQIEQWKLSHLQAQLTELEREQEALIAALNGGSRLHELFFAAHARRLGRLAQAMTQLRGEREQQALRLLEETGRARMAASLAQRAECVSRRASERSELDRVIEDFAGHALQASGKIAGP
ncbi:MAG TPA: hypothetical protein VFR00_03305 [Hyphomicrobiaceae bacterium]|jgi:hypothetical protein|nr:hypothetical protein [Hyphomicrobiaceae bacterium]